MDDSFLLTVPYKGKQCHFEVQLIVTGYTYQFKTMVNEAVVFFERDDAGEFRALMTDADARPLHSPDASLLQAIAHQLEIILS